MRKPDRCDKAEQSGPDSVRPLASLRSHSYLIFLCGALRQVLTSALAATQLIAWGEAIPTFIGIDLAWQSDRNHTGAAAFRGDQESVQCVKLSSGITTLAEVKEFIAGHESQETVVAIDAPLIIENDTGQRPCEQLISSRFGRFHAGAHTSNRSLYPNAGSVRLAGDLRARGYRHCSDPQGAWDSSGRWFFEVYPHPAHVVLFDRDRIIKYKKPPVARRRDGLREFQEEIRTRVFGPNSPFNLESEPAELLNTPVHALRGRGLKHHEDLLDGVLCAYLAYHLWRWGWTRNEMIGDLKRGYIVVPTSPLAEE